MTSEKTKKEIIERAVKVLFPKKKPTDNQVNTEENSNGKTEGDTGW